MKNNVGGIDRILRLVAGLALVTWPAMGGPVWAWVGVVLVATAAMRFCPVYPLLGMNTCDKK